MSKYIVDIDDFEPLFKVDSIGVFGIGKSVSDSDNDHSWSRIKSIEEFEELNSDYINEHFADLQETAYQKGLEDGKAQSENGCEGCRYESRTSEEKPCVDCSKNFDNHWMAKQTDKIKVGDEVEWDSDLIIVTRLYKDGGFDWCDGIGNDGRAFHILEMNAHKTGRHFDIGKILEEMKE